MAARMKITAGHLTRPKVGEIENGDGVVIRQSGPYTLIAVVDALGHGPIAADVRQRACKHLETVELPQPIQPLVSGLHTQLRNTRGAAGMVVVLHEGRLEGCGVGNVELRVHGSQVPVVLSPGVLGGSVRQLRVFQGTLLPPSRMILFSDGISSRFVMDHMRGLSPTDACNQLLTRHGHAHDDATVVVVDVER
jgi:negative regulator of sigma-B (phosphoserine phosphatase)